jgi:hypothetical protein
MCVKVFGIPEHVARHVFTLQSAYYNMTKYTNALCVGKAAADAEPDKAKKRSKPSMGWDVQILPIMNFGRGNHFSCLFDSSIQY